MPLTNRIINTRGINQGKSPDRRNRRQVASLAFLHRKLIYLTHYSRVEKFSENNPGIGERNIVGKRSRHANSAVEAWRHMNNGRYRVIQPLTKLEGLRIAIVAVDKCTHASGIKAFLFFPLLFWDQDMHLDVCLATCIAGEPDCRALITLHL